MVEDLVFFLLSLSFLSVPIARRIAAAAARQARVTVRRTCRDGEEEGKSKTKSALLVIIFIFESPSKRLKVVCVMCC